MGDPRPCAAGEPGCLSVELVLGFVDHDLPPALRAEVERRIDVCALCRALVAEAARSTDPEVRSDHDVETKAQRPGGRNERKPARPRSDDALTDDDTGPDELAPGEVIGRYVAERTLGAGGMGIVTLARDPELRRAVVIKLVRSDVFSSDDARVAFELRLRREAQAMAQLSHANVVQIFDTGSHRGRVFLAMEYVPGQTVDQWLIEKPRTIPEILTLLVQAGSGLAAAHHAGLVHRDFKPSNVLVTPAGVAKVTDFGLARAIVATDPMPPEAVAGTAPQVSGVHAVLTHADSVIGTPAYMAPEQAAGEPVDARTDQYSFALTLLDAVLDQSPAKRRTSPLDPAESIEADLAKAGVGAPQRAAMLRALALDPSSRFPTMDSLLAALVPRRRRTWPAAAAVLAVVVGGGVWFVARAESKPPCVAEARARWAGAARTRVVAALSASDAPFASWRAERIAEALDTKADALGAAQIARCEGTAPDGPTAAPACVERRRAAFEAALSTLAANPPVKDPWSVIDGLDRCDDAPDARAIAMATLRTELDTATTMDTALALAERAAKAGEHTLAADAHERAGIAAFARFELDAAERAFRAQAGAGEQAGDDAARGRALLHLIDLARHRGDHASAVQSADTLRAVLAKHRRAPRDVLVVASIEARALTELGDVARAEVAWREAADAAAPLDDPSWQLRIRSRRARAVYALHLDLPTAIKDAQAAVAELAGASDDAQREARDTLGELALIAGDGRMAQAAFGVSPHPTVNDQLRAARVQALVGDLDGALAALDSLRDPDPSWRNFRIELVRLQILNAAQRYAAARDVFATMQELRYLLTWNELPATTFVEKPSPLSIAEETDVRLAGCEAVRRAPRGPFTTNCILPGDLQDKLHPRAPIRAVLGLALVRESRGFASTMLPEALAILDEIRAPPAVQAEFQWELARQTWRDDRKQLAETARAAFQAAGRSDEVAAIDAWLVAGAPPPAAAP